MPKQYDGIAEPQAAAKLILSETVPCSTLCDESIQERHQLRYARYAVLSDDASTSQQTHLIMLWKKDEKVEFPEELDKTCLSLDFFTADT